MDDLYAKPQRLYAVVSILFFVFMPCITWAQCNNWSISAQLVNVATCAGNGGFNVTLSGPDVPNLSNIQYGIATMPNGFSVPLNNSANFSNMPPGTYQVSAVAMCGGSYIGKLTNASITVPGGYTPPTMFASLRRPTLDCGAYGQIGVNNTNGRPPFVTTLLSAPATYTGPLTFTSSLYGATISNLPAGYYTVQTTDACGSSTAPQMLSMYDISPTGIPLNTYPPVKGASCNTLIVPMPSIQYTDPNWGGYSGDPSFKVSVQMDNNLSAPSAFVNMGSVASITLPLSPGKSIKDCYGQNIIYTIKPPCGANTVVYDYIPYPSLYIGIAQNCNTDFNGTLNFSGLFCDPVTYTIHNNTTGTNYGPYSNATTPSLPLGNYTLTYTTADGYAAMQNMSASTIPGAPYSVSVINGAQGLTNYIDGFVFQCTTPQNNTHIELFNGPAGYYYSQNWYAGTATWYVARNMTPGAPGTDLFPPGNYVWKITDPCGTYFLPITVGAPDLYQFTTGIDHQQQTCNGLLIWPKGTATNNGQSKPLAFSLLKNGVPVYSQGTGQWTQYPSGSSILINTSGTYTLVPSSAPPTEDLTDIGYPNVYTNTYTFTYTAKPVQVDLNNTQGFLCKGAAPGQGIIYAKGIDGIPFPSPTPHYNYWLAHQGQGNSGPYITNNTTGIFTNFGGNANDLYDVKVVDSCGASAVQTIRILDLQVAHLISSNNYVACSLSTIQLTAAFLPNATYSWTGPNGFTSSLRNPVINSLDAQSAGVYRVTITTPQCGQPVTDSTIVAMAGNPPKPLISFTCDSIPPEITITNPSGGFVYKWDIHNFYNDAFQNHSTVNSSIGYTRYVYSAGSYRAIAIDTTNGCRTLSDSVFFAGSPYDTLQANITSAHLQVCQGDTTTLIAGSSAGLGQGLTYQWYKDGVPVPGATNIVYAAGAAGNYKVRVFAQPCSAATSDEVTVNVIPPPTASIIAPVQSICEGDHALITANTGNGFIYTWSYNDTTIPGASASSLYATRDGDYRVTISNGACVATSAPIHITVYPAPIIHLTPGTDEGICPGDVVHFQTTADPTYTYTWQLNGVTIPNAVSNTYNTSTPGTYTVTVANNPLCPSTVSQPVTISVLPHAVNLGNDTTVCTPGAFSIPLSIDPLFTQIAWSTGATTPQISVTGSGTYWVRASNPCGIFTDTIHVAAIADYQPTLPADTFICSQSNSGVLTVPALLQNIHWSNGSTSPSITIFQPGIYWVSGESPCGMLHDTVNVHFCAPVITGIQLKDTLCEGDCTSPVASVDNYPQTYSWTFTGGNPASATSAVPGNVCYSHEGIYPVVLTVTNAGGSNTFNTQVVVLPKPSPRFADTTVTVSYKTDVTLPACADAHIVDWYKDGELVCSNCNTISINAKYFRTVYHCIVSNGDCMDSCVYKLQVVDIPHDVWLPDAFTPNGDGRNDLFHVITDNPNVFVINLAVYNRWGQRIFNSNLNNGGWDGTVHGAPAEIGDYFWTLQYKIAGSTEIYSLKGDVTVVR